MASYLNLDDMESLTAKINERSPDIFLALPGRPQLEVSRQFRASEEETKQLACVEQNKDVRSLQQVKSLERDSKNSSQFFVIRQERSWTTLNISRELFEDLLLVYGVFPLFWKAVFTFGRKSQENEHTFPGFRARRSFPDLADNNSNVSYELAYVLRRVELNHRKVQDGESPWSIRQTAVYHKLNTASYHKESSSAFILIAPSVKFESQLSQSLELSKHSKQAIGPWNVHRLLISNSMSGWMDYMAWLEETLNEQSNFIIAAKVGIEKKSLSPLLDFKFNFVDRQTLKIIEDYVIDLQVILPTLLGNVIGVREQCQRCHEMHWKTEHETCGCTPIIAEFDEYVREVEFFIKRADVLREKTKSTVQLLSDLLSYEDAIALEKVAKESQNESRSMTFLTTRSTRDAAAVKVLTIISLIYLPTTIVANFFSTQFVHTDNLGNMAVAGNAWLLAAISIPLTFVTIACWWAWVRYLNFVNPATQELAPVVKIVRYDSFRSLRSLGRGRRQRQSDEESGVVSAAGTWSTATTAKSQ